MCTVDGTYAPQSLEFVPIKGDLRQRLGDFTALFPDDLKCGNRGGYKGPILLNYHTFVLSLPGSDECVEAMRACVAGHPIINCRCFL